jgi:hypothetical protein
MLQVTAKGAITYQKTHCKTSMAALAEVFLSCILPIHSEAICLLYFSGMSVLTDRMMGLEEVLQELAQYQVTNSALLQQLGGRISPNGQEPLMSTMRPGKERCLRLLPVFCSVLYLADTVIILFVRLYLVNVLCSRNQALQWMKLLMAAKLEIKLSNVVNYFCVPLLQQVALLHALPPKFPMVTAPQWCSYLGHCPLALMVTTKVSTLLAPCLMTRI